jgi:quercetin dioxygenase-like cupin family protein
MSKRLGLALLTAVIAVAAFAGMTLATPGVGVTSTTIAAGDLAPVELNTKTGDWKLALRTKGNSDVSVVENRVTPGGTFGWHNHLGPSIVVVKSGALTFYRAEDPTCTGEVYTAGQALLDPGNTIHVGRNEGTEDVVVITIRIIPDGAATRIDQPAPGNCAF